MAESRRVPPAGAAKRSDSGGAISIVDMAVVPQFTPKIVRRSFFLVRRFEVIILAFSGDKYSGGILPTMSLIASSLSIKMISVTSRIALSCLATGTYWPGAPTPAFGAGQLMDNE